MNETTRRPEDVRNIRIDGTVDGRTPYNVDGGASGGDGEGNTGAKPSASAGHLLAKYGTEKKKNKTRPNFWEKQNVR